MGGRPASPTALPIHAGSTGNAAHDILDVSPVNLIVTAPHLHFCINFIFNDFSIIILFRLQMKYLSFFLKISMHKRFIKIIYYFPGVWIYDRFTSNICSATPCTYYFHTISFNGSTYTSPFS